jgi:hypothetical protein
LSKSKNVLQTKLATAQPSRQGLAASEIARMVGLSVNEVSDLLEPEPSFHVGQMQLQPDVCSALAQLRESAAAAKSSASSGPHAQAALVESLHALRSAVGSGMLDAVRALGAGVEALPCLVREARKEEQAEEAVAEVLRSLGSVQEAAQRAQDAFGLPDPAL